MPGEQKTVSGDHVMGFVVIAEISEAGNRFIANFSNKAIPEKASDDDINLAANFIDKNFPPIIDSILGFPTYCLPEYNSQKKMVGVEKFLIKLKD